MVWRAGLSDAINQPVERTGFFNVIASSELHRLDGHGNRAVARRHDNRTRNLRVLQSLQDFNAVHTGQPDVEENHIRAKTVGKSQSLLSINAAGCLKALILERLS